MKRSQAAMAEAGSFVLVVGVGHFDLRLLRIAAVGVTRFQLFEILDGLFVIAVGHLILGFGVEFLRRPALGFVLDFRQQAATGHQQQQELTLNYAS